MKATPTFTRGAAALIAVVGSLYLASGYIAAPTPSTTDHSELLTLKNELSAKTSELEQLITRSEQQLAQQTATPMIAITGDESEQVQQLAQALAATQAELEALRLNIQDGNTLATPPAIQLSPEEVALQQTMAQEAQHALLERTLHGESIDPDWSPTASAQVRDSLANSQNIALEQLECASSMCMLTAKTSDEEAFHTLTQELAWEGEMYVNISAEGDMLAYLARPGSQLPRAEY